MRNSRSHLNVFEPTVLVYRRNDRTPLFGAVLLLALRKHLSEAALMPIPISKIADKILEYFPRVSFKKYPSSLPFERFRTTGSLTPTYQETLLIPCDHASAPLNKSYFQYRGYMIDPTQRKFTVLRGDPMEIPTQELCECFSDLQKLYASMLTPLRRGVYFPYRIEETYSLDALPDVSVFLSDAYSAAHILKKVSVGVSDSELDSRPEMRQHAYNSGR